MKLSVIIVNYNVRYFLEQALLSVRKAGQRVETEVWVVDNNSVDDSVGMVREKFPEVHLIANRHNPGFAVANNQAIRLARGEYVLLLNPDTVVEEDTFEKAVAFLDTHPDAGALGVKMIDGAGKFLPESKRGFPSPWVAFCKAFGLSALFPRSRWFNHYHLGYLSEHETHPVDVLSGAFFMVRRTVLEQIGLLDEAFFMYGEDIDLSYRVMQAGYQNYYLPTTTIIHYKGESTRKGSLNYVRVFYQAMIIFARKHFEGEQARLFILAMQLAIYLRAFLTLVAGAVRRAFWPLLDAATIFGGLLFLKQFWANYHFHDPGYYDERIVYLNFPLYLLCWLLGVFFSGGYDEPYRLRRLVRGLLAGTVLLAAIYGFLDLEYRSSRALIVLGALWALMVTVGTRLLGHFWQYRHFNLGYERVSNLLIVGSQPETERVLQLLQRAGVHKNLLGRVGAGPGEPDQLGSLDQLDEVAHIYRANEIIFCSRDVSAQQIMHWMTRLGPQLLYKILPEAGLSIIGSHSKHATGELYTIDIQYLIAQPMQRRAKRLLDLGVAAVLLLSFPLHLPWMRRPAGLLANCLRVLAGRRSWVGYAATAPLELPRLRPGVLSPLDGLSVEGLDTATVQRLDFFYAKDYRTGLDLEIMAKGYRRMGG